jgi:hypothetical protein
MFDQESTDLHFSLIEQLDHVRELSNVAGVVVVVVVRIVDIRVDHDVDIHADSDVDHIQSSFY